MKKQNPFLHTSHSFIAKLIGLIVLLACITLITLYTFAQIILKNQSIHDIFLAIVIIFLSFGIVIYFIHRLILPISKLHNGVKEISRGNLDIQIPVTSRDEIGKLAEAFNQMAKDLNNMIQAREQLLLDVSHELRTPLTRALLAIEMTEETEYTATVKKNLLEIQIMIKELLENHRLQNGFSTICISNLNLEKFLTDITNEYLDTEPGIRLNLISASLFICVDLRLMKIVIRNIIDNALKYSPKNSFPIEISVVDNTDTTSIIIEDFGDGIPSEELTRVFEPFYRTDKSRSRKTGGYGLGLHLCKKIMIAHEGEIQISNKKEGSGLRVTLILPKKTKAI